MVNNGFFNMLSGSEEFCEFTKALENKISPLNLNGVTESVVSHLVFGTAKKLGRPAVLVAPDGVLARRLFEDLRFFDSKALFYMERELVFYDIDTSANDITAQRIKTLSQISESDNYIVVTTPSALLGATVPAKAFKNLSVKFDEGEEVPENLSELFVNLGYSREDAVEGKGQYCIRGGIIDFFPFDSEYPYRVELFDTEVDTVRTFDISSQRTIRRVKNAVAVPASEYAMDAEKRNDFLEKLRDISKTAVDKTVILRDIERFENNGNFPSIDKYIPLLYGFDTPTVLDYFGDNTLFFIYEPLAVSGGVKGMEIRVGEAVASFEEKGIIPNARGNWHLAWDEALLRMEKSGVAGLFDIMSSCPDYSPALNLKFSSKEQASFYGKLDFFYDCLKRYKKSGYSVTVLAGSALKAQNIVSALCDIGIDASFSEILTDCPKKGEIVVTVGELENGFEYPLLKTAVVSDREIFGSVKRKKRRKYGGNGERIKSFTDLHVGDYVVHQNHGIGIFDGIKTMTVDGATADYLQIKFSGGDSLYVPANQLDVLYKYTGKEGANLRLNKLGGSQWAQTKQKVKSNCEDMARQLMELYAARQSAPGIEFSAQSDIHRSFDAAFPYDETDDQLEALKDVYADMEKPSPMDRLLCGDVGYGKTEVALRAAFKAAYDGYQVAYLVPTTILASQHYNTFKTRMEDFGINVALLSRFRTKKQQEETVRKINRGEVDIVIGTHRILQKDIKFKKLGLLVIDEEQRFGVSDKEKLKELKNNVDVLTLSATPIPRTLHMSMVGIRDMSVLENPPRDRYPVTTYVMEHNQDLVKETVLREIARGGQVYYLHNRTDNIELTAEKIRSFSPHIRVAYAHGKMSERELEKIMQQVIDNEVDVLVCTTIIETGLDIPNVNTIIIDDADKMGLSQLYQLRGRVGRSNKLAYAVLMYRPDKVLSEVAAKRLRAIRDFTEFGSGFKIALRDLEIRGAGNVIGAQQHGFMDSVGYDMYCNLLKEAVMEIRGEGEKIPTETAVSLNVSAYIPKEYIKGENYRIEMYKKISSVYSVEDYNDVYEEMEDRYGTLPPPVENLIEISLLRSIASESGFSEIKQKENNAILVFDAEKKLDLVLITEIISQHSEILFFSPTQNPYLTVRGQGKLISNIKIVLQSFKKLKDCKK